MRTVSKLFLALCTLEWLVLLGIGIALLVVDTDSEDEADPTSVYAWLSIFVVACHSLFTWDAIVGMTC
jgi:hypothetical protein